MRKKLINSILVLSIIVWGFIRYYFFYNVHYAKHYISGRSQDSYVDSWLDFLNHFSLEGLIISKWVATVLFTVGVFLICFIFTKINFNKWRAVAYLFSAMLLFSSLCYTLHLLSVPYTFQMSRRSLHFLQSPLPLMLLFIYYRFVEEQNSMD